MSQFFDNITYAGGSNTVNNSLGNTAFALYINNNKQIVVSYGEVHGNAPYGMNGDYIINGDITTKGGNVLLRILFNNSDYSYYESYIWTSTGQPPQVGPNFVHKDILIGVIGINNGRAYVDTQYLLGDPYVNDTIYMEGSSYIANDPQNIFYADGDGLLISDTTANHLSSQTSCSLNANELYIGDFETADNIDISLDNYSGIAKISANTGTYSNGDINGAQNFTIQANDHTGKSTLALFTSSNSDNIAAQEALLEVDQAGTSALSLTAPASDNNSSGSSFTVGVSAYPSVDNISVNLNSVQNNTAKIGITGKTKSKIIDFFSEEDNIAGLHISNIDQYGNDLNRVKLQVNDSDTYSSRGASTVEVAAGSYTGGQSGPGVIINADSNGNILPNVKEVASILLDYTSGDGYAVVESNSSENINFQMYSNAENGTAALRAYNNGISGLARFTESYIDIQDNNGSPIAHIGCRSGAWSITSQSSTGYVKSVMGYGDYKGARVESYADSSEAYINITSQNQDDLSDTQYVQTYANHGQKYSQIQLAQKANSNNYVVIKLDNNTKPGCSISASADYGSNNPRFDLSLGVDANNYTSASLSCRGGSGSYGTFSDHEISVKSGTGNNYYGLSYNAGGDSGSGDGTLYLYHGSQTTSLSGDGYLQLTDANGNFLGINPLSMQFFTPSKAIPPGLKDGSYGTYIDNNGIRIKNAFGDLSITSSGAKFLNVGNAAYLEFDGEGTQNYIDRNGITWSGTNDKYFLGNGGIFAWGSYSANNLTKRMIINDGGITLNDKNGNAVTGIQSGYIDLGSNGSAYISNINSGTKNGGLTKTEDRDGYITIWDDVIVSGKELKIGTYKSGVVRSVTYPYCSVTTTEISVEKDSTNYSYQDSTGFFVKYNDKDSYSIDYEGVKHGDDTLLQYGNLNLISNQSTVTTVNLSPVKGTTLQIGNCEFTGTVGLPATFTIKHGSISDVTVKAITLCGDTAPTQFLVLKS